MRRDVAEFNQSLGLAELPYLGVLWVILETGVPAVSSPGCSIAGWGAMQALRIASKRDKDQATVPFPILQGLDNELDDDGTEELLLDRNETVQSATPISVLIVDDDEADFLLLKRYLSRVTSRRYAATWARSVSGAHAALDSQKFDACIVDYHLGDADGLSIVREAHAAGLRLPFILVTGRTDAEVDDQAIRAGVMDFIAKGEMSATGLDRCLRYAIEISQKQDRLERLTYLDELTDLPNRRRFGELLDDNSIRAKLTAKPLGLIIVDIDDFREINTSAGYDIGDALLRRFSRRLAACIEPTDVLARIGGNTFGIIIVEPSSVDFLGLTAERILRLVDEQLFIKGYPLRVSCSIGIDYYSPGDRAPSLFVNAEAAMYEAKHERRGHYRIFSENLREKIEYRTRIARDLRIALEQDQLAMAFQPIVDADGHAVIAYEALVRWRRPDGSFVSPGDFIPVAEDTGFINKLGEWVLHKAAAFAAAQRASGQPSRVHVNISAKQLRERAFPEVIDEVLDVNNASRSDIVLEVTESVMMDDFDACIEMLDALHESGLHISIDDFGTGHSSLAYIQRIPLSSMKIDRTFVLDMLNDAKSAKIVFIIINLAVALGVSVVAEGVETKEQADRLTELGCNELQGYYFGRPEIVQLAPAAAA